MFKSVIKEHRFSILITVCLCVSMISISMADSVKAYERQIRQQKQELEKIKEELKFQRQQIKDIKVQESGVLNTISLMERNLNQTKDYIKGLESNAYSISNSIKLYEEQIDSMSVSLKRQKIMMEFRIKKLYMNGDPIYGKLKELSDFKGNIGRHIYFIKRILNSDQELVNRIQRTKVDLENKKNLLSVRMSELDQVKYSKKIEQRELSQRAEEQKSYLDNLKTNRNLQMRALEEYESNQKMLAKLISKLEKKRIAAIKKAEEERKKKEVVKVKKEITAKNKCWPMRGQVISKYGKQRHPILKTITRNLGIEIKGRNDYPVKAAAPGEVAMITSIQGRGTGVIIDHGNSFYTVYGHLKNIKVKEGDKLRRCQEIGNPSDEESMNGVKLFFQVSEGVKTVDPLKWLENAR